jgi:hypothetical protein
MPKPVNSKKTLSKGGKSMFELDDKFLNLCLSGEVDLEDIDDFIDVWHDSNSKEEIYDFLGLTMNEYALYVEKPSSLPYIIMSHRFGTSIEDALKFKDGFALAARAKDADEAHKVLQWLKKTGRI